MSDTKQTYLVTYPILGRVCMTVEADSEEDAKAAFWASVDKHSGEALTNPDFDEVEYDFVEEVVRGNVSYANPNRATVEQV